jgi:hypothetical protein
MDTKIKSGSVIRLNFPNDPLHGKLGIVLDDIGCVNSPLNQFMVYFPGAQKRVLYHTYVEFVSISNRIYERVY